MECDKLVRLNGGGGILRRRLVGAGGRELRAASCALRAARCELELSERQLALGVKTHKLSEKSMLTVAACLRMGKRLMSRLKCRGWPVFLGWRGCVMGMSGGRRVRKDGF